MRVQKNIRAGVRRGAVKAAAVLGAAFLIAFSHPMVSRAEATGTVLPNSVNIRKQPDQESEVIGSSSSGKEITIRGKVDASGITWYQVYVDANTLGYVRADMIEKKGDGDIPTVSADAPAQQTEGEAAQAQGDVVNEGGAKEQAQEAMDRQYANIKVQAKVRPDPSTTNTPVDSLKPGTQVVISGKSEGSDGKTWYFVTFTGGNGSERTGFIRSDLLELGELLPAPEEPEAEEPEPETEEPVQEPRKDYELKIESVADGEEVWYIYDNVTGQKQKLVPLLESSYGQSSEEGDEAKSMVKQRIVIVVLAVLLLVLVVAVVIMAIKLRDAYYEDYEDDEEDEEEEDDGRAARRNTGAAEREQRGRAAATEAGRPRRRDEADSDSQAERRERRRREEAYREEQAETARPARTRKAKNFLLDDDEFEFEFLNMDDKDLN